ncbi:MAG: hypothetical protein HY904_00845 [Deltaproteobacteria bacterium]|nr:hypothetical protein [Deltaproteobacteria bacterium]
MTSSGPPNGADAPALPDMDARTEAEFDRAAERLEALLGALPVFRAVATSPGMPESIAAIEQDLALVTTALARTDLSAAVLQHLAEAEADLVDLDEHLPDSAVRRLLREGVPPQAVVPYARLLAWHLSPERFERVVDTMLCLCTGPDGVVLPFDGVKDILIGLGARSDVTLETLGAACNFFEGAIQRLATFESLDALFDAGFILDVAGYRISLRNQLLEPEILYASLRLEAAFRSRLADLAKAGGVSLEALDGRLVQAHLKVDEVFKIARRQAGENERFVRRRVRTGAIRVVQEASTVPPPTRLGARMRQLAVAFIMVAGPLAAWNVRGCVDDGLSSLGRAELVQLSPLLVEGGLSAGPGPRVFIGRVDPGRWLTLSRSDRMAEARRLADRLDNRGIRHAFVSREATVAVRLEDGRIMQVE